MSEASTSDQFRYCDFQFSSQRRIVSLRYELRVGAACHSFTERVTFPFSLPDTPFIQDLICLLHIASGISYYKTLLPNRIVTPYALSRNEASFWNHVFQSGLGEFLFTNHLPLERVAKFSHGSASKVSHQDCLSLTPSALLGIGGGKDSIVAGELLKQIGIPCEGFVVVQNDVPLQVAEVAREMSIPLHVVQRTIDPKIRSVSSLPEAYNGHIPISVLFGIVGCLLAAARGHRYVAVGNEASSSIPQVRRNGVDVNHQWSKSLEFETLFQQLILNTMGQDMVYFSPIRPLSSVAVSKMFSAYPNYFGVFSSDSSMFRMDKRRHPKHRWSLESPKSLSSFILLLPWIDESEVTRVFECDLLNEASLESLFLSLLGASESRTLDCVGTPDELRLSLRIAATQKKCRNSCLMVLAQKRDLMTDLSVCARELQGFLDPKDEHRYPEALEQDLMETIRASVALEKTDSALHNTSSRAT